METIEKPEIISVQKIMLDFGYNFELWLFSDRLLVVLPLRF